jgi:hypothetical protein
MYLHLVAHVPVGVSETVHETVIAAVGEDVQVVTSLVRLLETQD